MQSSNGREIMCRICPEAEQKLKEFLEEIKVLYRAKFWPGEIKSIVLETTIPITTECESKHDR